MPNTLIHQAKIVSDGTIRKGSVLVAEGDIVRILTVDEAKEVHADHVVDANGAYLLPGVIDEHVHFRDPGMTAKATVASESAAALAGGVTSVMDMPNTQPPCTTAETWEQKMAHFAQHSLVNYSCFLGATKHNREVFEQLPADRLCGIKLFMGSSTGNMLVEGDDFLHQIFSYTDKPIVVHAEDQTVIARNTDTFKRKFEEREIPVSFHPFIRSAIACYKASKKAVELARQHGSRLHLAHVSTQMELSLLDSRPLAQKRITAEACLPHLLFSDRDYETLGTKIKCNPAIKRLSDRDALRRALNSGLIDCVATDHAPHLPKDKEGDALHAASGIPMVQFSLVSMLELVDKKVLALPQLVELMCHHPAQLFGIRKRGFIREGYRADLVLVRPKRPWTLTSEDILSRCGWSPLEGHTFDWRVERTWVNGHLLYADGQVAAGDIRGEELRFDRLPKA